MKNLFVFEKYNYAELVALDILMQKADAFNDSYHVSTFPGLSNRLFLSFNDGFKFLHLNGYCKIFVAKDETHFLEIKKYINEINNSSRKSHTIILLLDDNVARIKIDRSQIIINIDFIKNDLNNYAPFYYDDLIALINKENKPSSSGVSSKKQISSNSPIAIKQISSKDYSKDFSQKNADEYKKYLETNPQDCVFILGNGVSIPLGADPWDKLINNLVDYLTPFYISDVSGIVNELSKSNYLVSSFVKSTFIEKGQEDVFKAGLKYCVYRKFNKSMLKENTLLKSVALSKIKYPELTILTYNYDNFLEQQIMECDPSKKVKSYSGKSFNKHILDKIIHLHGTIKLKDETIDKRLVLTDEEYFDAYLNNNNNWTYKAQYESLFDKKCLFIGSSMSDVFQLSIIEKKKQKGEEWSCYALLSSQGLGSNEISNLLRFYKDKGIRVIFVDDFKFLADRLNDITNCYFDPQIKSFSK